MPIFPYDEEERRRRLMLTPGINPNAALPTRLPDAPRPPWTPGAVTAIGGDVLVPEKPTGLPGDMRGAPPSAMGPGRPSSLPEIPSSLPRPALGASIPGGMTPMAGPGATPLPIEAPIRSRGQELYDAREDYKDKAPGRLKSGLLGALRGGLQGLGSGAGLGGALGGAIAGGAAGGINPRGLREVEFNERVKPKILERFQYEDADRAARAATQKAQMDAATNQANMANTQDQIRSRQAGDALNQQKANYEQNNPKLIPVAPGGKLYNPTAGKEVFTAPERTVPPKAPTAAELATDPDDGMSVEEKARASFEARGGDQYVFDGLPARTKQLLDKGTITGADGKELTADPAEVRAAERALQTAINRQWQADLSYTQGATRSKVLAGRGGTKGAASQGAKKTAAQSGPRNLKDLTNLWK